MGSITLFGYTREKIEHIGEQNRTYFTYIEPIHTWVAMWKCKTSLLDDSRYWKLEFTNTKNSRRSLEYKSTYSGIRPRKINLEFPDI